jgi:hypothetical protein
MVFASLQRVGLLVAQVAVESIVRGCHTIVDYFYVPTDGRFTVRRIEGDQLEGGQNDPPPAYSDVFENSSFVSTDYKDDRAAVNLTNSASHANTLAHAKRCECKTCRDRKPAFRKRGTGRRYGYQGTPIHTRTAPVELAALSQCRSTSQAPSADLVRNTRISEKFPESPPQESRLRGGDLQILRAVCNRFAILEVEKTQDEEDPEQHGAEHDDDDIDETWCGNPSTLPPIEIPTLHPEEPLASHPLAQLATALDNQTDNDADDSDLDDRDIQDFDNTILPATANLQTTTRAATCTSMRRLARWPLDVYHRGDFRRFTAIAAASDSLRHGSDEMPWELEDDDADED